MAKQLPAKKMIERARAGLVIDAPFWASICLKLEMIEDKEGALTQTMATDGKSIYYFPDFVEELSGDEVKGVLAHEVGHVVLLHPWRRADRDLSDWNQAADFSINPILIEAGFKLTDGALVSHEFTGKEAEANYATIHGRKLKEPKPKPEDGPGKGKDKKEGAADPGAGKPGPGKGGASGAGEKPGPCPDPGRMGGVMDFPGTPAERKQAEEEQKITNKQAAQIAKKQGKLPGSLDRLVDELTKHSVNWKEALAQFVDCNARNDYNFKIPNRRFLPGGVFMPSLMSPALGHVVVLVDASGSVDHPELIELVSEAAGMLDMYEGVRLSVIFFDTRASSVFEITDETDFSNLKIPNLGGGTDYRPGFKKIEAEGLTPVCVVVLTDGACDSFPDDPGPGVLWVINNERYFKRFNNPFGDKILMPKGEDRE